MFSEELLQKISSVYRFKKALDLKNKQKQQQINPNWLLSKISKVQIAGEIFLEIIIIISHYYGLELQPASYPNDFQGDLKTVYEHWWSLITCFGRYLNSWAWHYSYGRLDPSDIHVSLWSLFSSGAKVATSSFANGKSFHACIYIQGWT